MESKFDGSMWQMIGWQIVCWAITICTLGIAYPWGACFLYRWEAEHSIINGKRLKFTGTGGGLFVLYLKLYFGCIGILLGMMLILMLLSPGVRAGGMFALMFGATGVAVSLCMLAVMLLFGSYVILRIKRWRVEHTEFEQRDPPAPSQYAGYRPDPVPAPAPAPAPPKAFRYSSKDMVRGSVMCAYVKRFGFDGGLAEPECKALFDLAEQAVAPDVEVVTAFIAHQDGDACACAMAASKLIIASKQKTTVIPLTDISAFDLDGNVLTVRGPEQAPAMTVSNRQICDVCNASLKACQEELAAKT